MTSISRSRILPEVLAGCVFALLFAAAAQAQTDCRIGAGPLRIVQPEGVTVAEIIQQFAANESIFKAARKNYSYAQEVTIETLLPTSPGEFVADGEFRLVMDISHDEKGRRLEYVKFAPQSTLRRVSLGPDDFEDIRVWAEFQLTTEELPRYQIYYDGEQQVDELGTYVFEIAPKVLEMGRRYFQGRIWVERSHLEVVKTCGKSVPDVVPTKKKKRAAEEFHPTFASYRQLIDGKYWFPTYTRSDDLMPFSYEAVRVREIIKNTNYRPTGPKLRTGRGETLTGK